MKKRILEVLKDSGTMPAVINTKPIGIYVFENAIYCLMGGDDFEFDELSESDKEIVLNDISNGNYSLNASWC
jgi:hypothetical protein